MLILLQNASASTSAVNDPRDTWVILAEPNTWIMEEERE